MSEQSTNGTERKRCIVIREPWYVEDRDEWHMGTRVVERDIHGPSGVNIEKFEKDGSVVRTKVARRSLSIQQRDIDILANALADFDRAWELYGEYLDDWNQDRCEVVA